MTCLTTNRSILETSIITASWTRASFNDWVIMGGIIINHVRGVKVDYVEDDLEVDEYNKYGCSFIVASGP